MYYQPLFENMAEALVGRSVLECANWASHGEFAYGAWVFCASAAMSVNQVFPRYAANLEGYPRHFERMETIPALHFRGSIGNSRHRHPHVTGEPR